MKQSEPENLQRNLALLRPRYQSGAGKVKFQTAIKMEKDHRGIFPRMQFHQLDISKGKSDIGKEQLMDQELFNVVISILLAFVCVFISLNGGMRV